MTIPRRPAPHHDPWVDLLRGYVTGTVRALQVEGLFVDRTWLDPYDPRDATIVLDDGLGLVWDEQTGWRRGHFASGRQGVRTVLDSPAHLGGGVLPDPRAIARALTTERSLGKVAVPYRAPADRDGLDQALLLHWPAEDA